VSTEQRENLDAILRQSAFPAGSDVNEQRRLLRALLSAQPLPADVIVTAALNATAPTPIKRGATQALPSTNARLLESAPFLC
jgi:hypothetical protein